MAITGPMLMGAAAAPAPSVRFAAIGCATSASESPDSRGAPAVGDAQGPAVEIRGAVGAVAYLREVRHSCGRAVELTASWADHALVIEEVWSGVMARCLCTSKVSGLIEGVLPGEVEVRVVAVELPPPNGDWTTTSTEIHRGPVTVLDRAPPFPDALVRTFAESYREVLVDGQTWYRVARVVRDLDGDGLDDVLLSCTSEWGNSGGYWSIFLARPDHPDGFLRVGQLFFHPLAVRFRPGKGVSTEVVAYVRGGAEKGQLVTSTLSAAGVGPSTAEEMRPGGVDRARYDELFGHLLSQPVASSTALTSLLGEDAVVWSPGHTLPTR